VQQATSQAGAVNANRSGVSAQQGAATDSALQGAGGIAADSAAATDNSASVKKSNGKMKTNGSSSFDADASARR
jgi:hypothetical protein